MFWYLAVCSLIVALCQKTTESTCQEHRKIVEEVAKFMLEISGEDSVQRPWTATSSWSTMANFQIPPPDILELNDGSTAANWQTWVSAWKKYTLATKLDKQEEERQVATLLAVITNEANKVFRTFTCASEGDTKKIAPVLKKFEDYCIPRENTIYERFLFLREISENLKQLINM